MSVNMDDAGYWNSPEQCEVADMIKNLRSQVKVLEKLKTENESLRKDAERFQYLQNCDQKIAQAFFWHYSSRKARAKAIDAAMEKEK